ncbi:MAG TPA: Ig-like domain-containing protein [Actinomycetota bacterium]|nr:Ig-like domain-containing protein [Actinomycetota bacterium]
MTTASANHPGGSVLDCTPEQAANPTTGTTGGAQGTGNRHTITCQLEDPNTNQPVQATGPVAIDFEIDCFSGCGDAAYTTTTQNPTTNQATVAPTANEAGVDGDQPVGTTDDIRQSAVDMTCVVSSGASSCTVTYQRTDASAGGPNAGDIDIVAAWIDHDGSDATDESDGGETPGADDNDNTDAVQKNWEQRQATNVDCGPANATNQTGTQHTTTCTTTDQFGQPVNNAPGPVVTSGGANTTTNCDANTNANGQGACQMQNNGNPDTVTVRQCTVDSAAGTGNCDTQTKTFQAGQASGVDATPETDTNTVGDQHVVTCNVFNQFGNTNNNQGTTSTVCNFEFFTGSPSDQDGNTTNSPDRSCTTPNNANSCQITYFSNAAGTDLICVYLGTDEVLAGNNNGGTCDGEGLTDPTTDNGTPDPATDDQDVVQKVWQAAAGPATQVNAEPEDDTNPVSTAPCTSIPPGAGGVNGTGAGCSAHTIGVFAGAANNAPTTATPIRADILPGSPNASQASGQAEVTCAVDNTAGPGITFPAGQSQTHECTYTSNGSPGTDTVRVFADTNGNNIFDQGEPFDDVIKRWGGQAFALAMTDGDTATAGTCNEFTVRITDQQGNPVVGQIVDVSQTLTGAGTEPGEDRELAFCNPTGTTGPNPTGQGGTAFGDVSGNNAGQTAGQPGRNTTVRGEVGPTNNNGEVTFGITINNVPVGQTATVNVRSWVDVTVDNDTFDAGEPTDTATKTWTPGGTSSVTGMDATPETATNPNGTSHQVTVTVTGASGPIQGVTPNSIIASNAAGRPAGDVADANAGTSPNAAKHSGNFNVYNCTATNAQGVSTCTYQDDAPATTPTPAGTDTIVFYVNQAAGGTAGPDANEPQDAVQKTWTAGPQNLAIDLQCTGTGTGDDLDVGENAGTGNQPGGTAENGNVDCSNPVSDQDEVFTAFVTTQAGVGQPNVRVDFQFGNRTNANAAGANNSTDDATLNATPGGQIGTTNPPGGPALQTFCLTNANGTCSVTLTNPTPQAGDIIDVTAFISGQTTPVIVGGTRDTATKAWQAGAVNQVGTLTLTPRAATNQVGTQHTVTATVLNQFGQPVQGANVDFRITNGPNAGLAQAGMTDATTNAAGQATFTYTSNAVGQDTIAACTETGGSENDTCDAGEPNATATKNWQTGPVTTGAVNLDMQSRQQSTAVVPGPPTPAGADTAVDDCEVTTPNNTNRETTASNQINPNQATGAAGSTNFHEICAAAFQTNAQAPTPGAQITFTITGVGRIFAVGANERCSTATTPAAGTTVTVTADQNGIARACLFSQQVGRTNVTASSGTPAVSDTGTKDWTVNPSTARFIQLCHGDVAGTTCVTENQTNEPNDDHQLTARVTDRQGNPVAGVPVQFRETGPGIFTPQGGSTATVNTDANGLASVLLTSDVVGDSTIVAEISPPGTVGGFRGAGANDDECEAPAGTNNQPAAGNCVSQTLTKLWRPETVDPECDNGEDDDNDGFIDEEDPGCEDGTEAPQNPPVFERTRHERRISIRFNDGTGARNNGLVVFGRLRLGQDGTNPECFQQVPVNVQRRINGRWVTKKTTTTNRRGRYAVEIFDQASRYRAVAPRHEIVDDDLRTIDICLKAVKAKRHRHRR